MHQHLIYEAHFNKRKTMKKILTTLAILSSSLAQAAPFVFPSAWTTSTTNQTNQGTYRSVATTDFKLNPFTETTVEGIELVLTPRGLFLKDPISGDTLPYMAESYSVSANKLVWTVKLRPEMKWSDGTPMTARDWVVTAKIHSSAEIVTNRRDRFFIDGKPVEVTSPDPQTIVYSFPKVVADALDTMSVVPWPAHVFEPVLNRDGAAGIKAMWAETENPEKIVSAGAFKLASYQKGVRIIAERNPYFGEWNKNGNGIALPYLNRTIREVYKDRATLIKDFLSGESDQIETTIINEIKQIQEGIKAGTLPAVLALNAVPQTTTLFMNFNWNKSADLYKQNLFRNILFRQAISHMMNRQAIVNEAYGGYAKVAYNAMTDAFGEWKAPNLEVFKYDLNAARALLAKIGYSKLNANNLLVNREGNTIEFKVLAPNTSGLYKQVFDIMIRDAEKVGIRIIPEYVATGVLLREITTPGKNRNWDAVLTPLAFNTLTNYPISSAVYSCKGRVHVIFNASGECLDPLETQAMILYERGRQTLDQTERRAIVHKIQEVEQKLQTYIFLAAPSTQVAWQNRIQGEFADYRLNGIRFPELTWVK
jgi:peptide/nickel transport system substrate-binding protein